jgi:hypothetical protein
MVAKHAVSIGSVLPQSVRLAGKTSGGQEIEPLTSIARTALMRGHRGRRKGEDAIR